MNMTSDQLDQILWRHISALPYFRGLLRAVEDSFYQDITLPDPVLDLGSGDGHFASVAFDRPLAVGLDPWYKPMQEAKLRNTYQLSTLAEGANIPFRDESFSSINSTSVLEHIPEVEPVLNEAARVLKRGGMLVFCVPNHRFPQLLWGRQLLEKAGFKRLGLKYSRFFDRLARHAHTDSPEKWQQRLDEAGFDLVETWDYFPPEALAVLEWGHPLGIPSLITKKLFGQWILCPQKWNLIIPWYLTRKYLDNPKSPDGVCSFFIARKR